MRAKDPSFGNARGVRNLFEQVLVQQANRIASLTEITKETLMEITQEDVLSASKVCHDKPDRKDGFEEMKALMNSLGAGSLKEGQDEQNG